MGECGRSLTEMLGTLAIMGVLSIVGVWSFNLAMNRHDTNTLIHEAGKRATVVMGQLMSDNTPNLADFTDNTFSEGNLIQM